MNQLRMAHETRERTTSMVRLVAFKSDVTERAVWFRLAAEHDEWPRFRLSATEGAAFIGFETAWPRRGLGPLDEAGLPAPPRQLAQPGLVGDHMNLPIPVLPPSEPATTPS